MVAEQTGCSVADALVRLTDLAHATDATLDEVATIVIDGGVDFRNSR
jgi:hypothetical protein